MNCIAGSHAGRLQQAPSANSGWAWTDSHTGLICFDCTQYFIQAPQLIGASGGLSVNEKRLPSPGKQFTAVGSETLVICSAFFVCPPCVFLFVQPHRSTKWRCVQRLTVSGFLSFRKAANHSSFAIYRGNGRFKNSSWGFTADTIWLGRFHWRLLILQIQSSGVEKCAVYSSSSSSFAI